MYVPGFGEWALVAVVVAVVFGAKKLPEVGESLGKSIKAFKKSVKEDDTPPEKENKGKSEPKP